MSVRRYAVLLVLALLAGCAQPYVLVAPQPVSVGDLKLVPPVAFNGRSDGIAALWTIDGPMLDRIYVVGGIGDGHAAYAPPKGREVKMPVFRASATPMELVDLFVTSLNVVVNGNPPQVDEVGQTTFLGQPGVRFHYQYVDGSGVKRKGLVVAGVVKGKLYGIDYSGTALYHYDAYLPQVEKVIASARLD